jgi:hypothetical protein
MTTKALRIAKAPRSRKRDTVAATESAKKDELRREQARVRQERHRDRVRSEEGAGGLEGLMTPRDREQSRAFGNELARLASQYRGRGARRTKRPRVVVFRERCLGGGTLSTREARRLLITASVYLWGVEDFARHDIPIRARVQAAEHQPTFLSGPEGIREEWLLKFLWDGTTKTVSAYWTYNPSDPDSNPPPPSPAPWNDVWGHNRCAVRGSIMDELLILAHELMDAYLWSEEQAILFVLTGLAPEAVAMRIASESPEHKEGDHQQFRLVVSVQPWVTTETVANIYRAFQKQVLSGRNRTINRQPKEDSLRFFDFVAERWHAGRSWREMCADWNAAHPDQAYRPDQVRSFQRDFKQIYKLMMGVEVRVSGGKPGRPKGSKNNALKRSGSPAEASLTVSPHERNEVTPASERAAGRTAGKKKG